MKAQNRVATKNRSSQRPFKKAQKTDQKEFAMALPSSLPFIEALEKRYNKRIHKDNEQVLLANYEKHWVLKDTFGGISGKEERYLRYLAKKYNSFILNRI